jgi:hypothetical protein
MADEDKIGIELVLDNKGAIKEVKQFGKVVDKTTDKAEDDFDDLTSSISGSTIAISALAAAGAATLIGIAKFSINAQKEAEKVQTQFETLLGSAGAAQERFSELADFAATTPFELGGIAKASKILQSLTGELLSTGDGLRLVGDAAAIAGVPIDELAVSLGRASSGLLSNRAVGEPISRLQELGLISGETRNKIEALQKQAKGKEAWEVLRTELEKNSGGMAKLSETAGGLESTLSDVLTGIGRTVAVETGIFELYKDSISGLISLGGEINAAWDSTSVEKVRDELEDINKELKRNEALLKSSAELGTDAGLFEKRSEALRKQKKELEEAIAPATLKDKQKELKEAYAGLAQNVQLYTSAIDVNLEEQNALTAGLLLQSGALLHTKDAYKGAAEVSKQNILILEAQIEGLKTLTGAQKEAVVVTEEETASTVDQATANQVLADSIIKVIDLKNKELETSLKTAEFAKSLAEETALLGTEGRERALLELQFETDQKELAAIKQLEDKVVQEAALTQIEKNEKVKREAINKKFDDADMARDKIKNRAALDGAIGLTQALIGLGQSLFGKSKEAAIASALINTFQGVTKAYAQGGIAGLLTGGTMLVSGLAQVNNIRKQKGFRNGTEFVEGPGSSTSDSISARLSVGERVVDAQTNQALGGISNEELADRASGPQTIIQQTFHMVTANIDELAQLTIDAIQVAKDRNFTPGFA